MNKNLEIEFITKSPDETFSLGLALGQDCKGGECFMLHGTLGAGKTCLLQGMARGLEVPQGIEVVSPTFVIHCQYEGRLIFNHIDAYRLDGAMDFDALGFDEMFDDKDSVTAVEWAEIIDSIIPEPHIEIKIELLSATERLFKLSGEKNIATTFQDTITAFGKFST